MKDWVIVFLDSGLKATDVTAVNITGAIEQSGLDPDQIVSIHCVNTPAPVGPELN